MKNDERQSFMEMLNRPPHNARMNEHAQPFISRLDAGDKEALLEDALERMWETRDQVHTAQDILKLWLKALEYAARQRPRWCLYFNVYEKRWVKGAQLGKQR